MKRATAKTLAGLAMSASYRTAVLPPAPAGLLGEGEVVLRTVTGLNAREHHMERSTRAKRERRAGAWAARGIVLRAAPGVHHRPPYLVTLTRVGPRRCDDDNLQVALKSFRDGVADELGVDDGDVKRVRWAYAQTLGRWAVKLRIDMEVAP